MMESKNIIRVVASPCHEQHSLSIGVVLLITHHFLQGNGGTNLKAYEAPIGRLVASGDTRSVVVDHSLVIEHLHVRSHLMPSACVGHFVGKCGRPKAAVLA